jgi:alanine dehydrogenase
VLKLCVVGTSRKPSERRVAIHPEHVSRIPERLRSRVIFEEGYGERFGVDDAELARRCGGTASRAELLSMKGAVVLLPKPLAADLGELREHGVLWGWPHCVQQTSITQTAIDRKLTLIAFEAMFTWGPDGHRGLHTFYKNNEMAGYAAVLDALRLRGADGHYGRRRKVVVLSFGAVSRGAIYALKARGIRDITICILRPDHLNREEILGCRYVRMREGQGDQARLITVEHDGTVRSLVELIRSADIVVNGTFQDPNRPIMFVTEEETARLKPGGLIIDVSCDEGMGFHFARPTSFDEPMFRAGPVDYYGVDHTPSYLWDSASWEISTSLLRFLPSILDGPAGWEADETLRRAIEIQDGRVRNPDILSFQTRSSDPPYAVVATRSGPRQSMTSRRWSPG